MKKLTPRQLSILKLRLIQAENNPDKFHNLYDDCRAAEIGDSTLYVITKASTSDMSPEEKLTVLAFLISIGKVEELPESWEECDKYIGK